MNFCHAEISHWNDNEQCETIVHFFLLFNNTGNTLTLYTLVSIHYILVMDAFTYSLQIESYTGFKYQYVIKIVFFPFMNIFKNTENFFKPC